MSVFAVIVSCISLLWQIVSRFAKMKVEIVDVFESIGTMGMQYIFRINIYNLSYSSISVSNIDISIDKAKLSFDYQSRALAINSGGLVPGDVIRSVEFPVRIDSTGAFGGYFYILDSYDELKLVKSPKDVVNITLKTNRGNFKFKVDMPKIRSVDDLEP